MTHIPGSTAVSGADDGDGRPHRPARRARTLWATGAGLGCGVLGAVPGGLGLLADGAAAAVIAMLVGAVLGAVGGMAFGRAVWVRRTWLLGPTALELRRGVIVQRASWIPYYRIQQIDLERGPIERMAGLAQLVVRTAAATTDGTVYGLVPGDAARIRGRLLELAGVDDAV